LFISCSDHPVPVWKVATYFTIYRDQEETSVRVGLREGIPQENGKDLAFTLQLYRETRVGIEWLIQHELFIYRSCDDSSNRQQRWSKEWACNSGGLGGASVLWSVKKEKRIEHYPELLNET
jgi:hypothetical protein